MLQAYLSADLCRGKLTQIIIWNFGPLLCVLNNVHPRDSAGLLYRGIFCLSCRVMYDRAVDFWVLIYTVLQEMEAEANVALPRKSWGQFWSAHQRFFRQMLMAAKVNSW
jgi:hypothetical protein